MFSKKHLRGERVSGSPSRRRGRFESATRLLMFSIVTLVVSGTFASAKGANGQSSSAPSTTATQTYEGMITDTHCGAKHSAAMGLAASDCARACVHAGEQFVLVHGDHLFRLEGDSAALKQVAGQRVRIIGSLNGQKISVSSVTAEK